MDDSHIYERESIFKAENFAKFGFWEYNLSEGRFYTSEGARLIYGTSKEILTLEEVKSFRVSGNDELLDKVFVDLIAEGKPYDVEFRVKNGITGEILYVRSKAEYNKEKNIVFGILSDISDVKLAMDELILEKARMASLLKISQFELRSTQEFFDFALAEAISLTNSKYGYLYFYDEDKETFTLNSWSKDVMPQCKVVEINTCYELDKTGFWGEAVRQRKPIILNDFIASNPLKKGYPEGHVHLTKFCTIPVFQGDKILAVVGVANKGVDYTDSDVRQLNLMMDWVWKIVEGKKKDNKLQQLTQAVEQSPASIILTDLNGNIEYANSTFSKVSGYQLEEVIGKNPRILKSGYTTELKYKELWETISSGESWRGEFQNKSKSGELYWESALISPVKNEQNEIINFLAIKSDITAIKHAEFQKELITTDLINQNQALQQFAFIVSHNLRAPVANIIGLNQLLLEPGFTEEERKEVLLFLGKSIGLLDIVIKDISKILYLKKAIDGVKEEISFSAILKEIIGSLKLEISNSKCEIYSDFKEVKGMVTLKTYIVSIFQNLIVNSIKYHQVGKAPIVHIRTRKVGNGLELEFVDNGMGINLDKYGEQIFGLYRRFHPGRSEGTGLGLYMVKTQVEALHGKISIESKENEGTKFTLFFLQESPISFP